MIVSGQLDPRNDLQAWEDRLRAWEANLVSREQELKQKLQAEMERLLVDFEINHYEKITGLQKRFLVHEKSVKAKIKQIEGKGNPAREQKLVKPETFKPPEIRPGQNNDDKLLLKLVSLEKANEILKQKNLELEAQLQKKSNSDSETLEEKSVQDENDVSNSPNISKISKKEKSAKVSGDKAGEKIGEKALTKTVKKKTAASSTAGAKSTVSYASELKVSLQLLEKIAYCLRFSVPFASGLQISKQNSLEAHLFPLSESLLAYLTELIHLVNRPSSSKDLQGVFEMFYKLLKFKWKDQVKGEKLLFEKSVSEPEINSVINKAKTSKDHVEEIMNSTQYQCLVHKEFSPITDYWKKLIKSEAKKETEPKSPSLGQQSNTFKLFSNPCVQKEIVRILILFLSTSDLMLLNQAPQGNEAQNENEILMVDVKVNLPFDSVKNLLQMRIMSALTILLLANNTKEFMTSLNCLKADLFGKTNKINNFLKNYFVVECSGTEVLANVLDINSDKVIIQFVSEISALLKE